jgi:UDPglucose 6-dehydrogenase
MREVKTIGVVGNGVLGRAVARGFMEHAEIFVHDSDPNRSAHSLDETLRCDVVFFCLPTPALSDGRCDTSVIDQVFDRATNGSLWQPESTYVIRSTVPVGYTSAMADRHRLPLLHSPEFLTARCALVDFQTPARNIIGFVAECGGCDANLDALAGLYQRRFPGVPIHYVSTEESELIKLAVNSFFAAKVMFFNVIAATAEKHHCNWERVREGILSDGRIAHAHTQVPGPSGERGYGGACLPKDIADFRHMVPAELRPFVEAIEQANRVVRGETDGGLA